MLMSVYAGDNPLYVRCAIESMENQTVRPDQIVIVVDGPVSHEVEEVLKEKEDDTNSIIEVYRLETNGGLANALNLGLTKCRNDLVARMDADDISLPMRCERELEQFAKNVDLKVCGCNLDEFETVFESEATDKYETKIVTSRIVPEKNKEIYKFMRKRQPVNHASVIYRKSAVQQVGGYIPLPRKEDFDLFSRMVCAKYAFYNVQEHLYLCRVCEANYRRRKSWKNCKSAMYVYGRHFKRGGCNLLQYIEICSGELIFFLLPYPWMKWLSDKLLRSKK